MQPFRQIEPTLREGGIRIGVGEARPRERNVARAAPAGKIFDGNLGIGSEQPGYELDQAATVRAEYIEERVELSAVGRA